MMFGVSLQKRNGVLIVFPSIGDLLSINCKKLLDVGCGNHGWPHTQFAEFEKVQIKVGLDLNEDRLHTYDDTDWLVMPFDLTCPILPFMDNYFDITFCLDVIEHLKSDDAYWLVEEIKRCSKRIVLYTPEGFFDTTKYQKDLVKSDLDVHKSGFTAIGLELWGFKVERIGPIYEDDEATFYGLYGYWEKH